MRFGQTEIIESILHCSVDVAPSALAVALEAITDAEESIAYISDANEFPPLDGRIGRVGAQCYLRFLPDKLTTNVLKVIHH